MYILYTGGYWLDVVTVKHSYISFTLKSTFLSLYSLMHLHFMINSPQLILNTILYTILYLMKMLKMRWLRVLTSNGITTY
ncbi:MAG: hypothetical protein AMS23_05050 [Bacteroides sp. SM1_62]|nr:MAG: hypothetical protein AMS26_08160 [Bacteroides sp. SM23_62]KPL25217.1 MAG: hypothetical protein AMS23_05050 [Bacteroides sp. SM1_62]